MNYLKYIELSAENLQFFLWFRDYTKRFNDLPESEKALSAPWTDDDAEAENPARAKKLNPETAAVFKGTDFANENNITVTEKSNPFFTPPRTPNGEAKRDGESFDTYDESVTSSGGKVNHTQRASGAFESAGLKWKPCKFLTFYFFNWSPVTHYRQCLFNPTVRRLLESFPSTSPTTVSAS